MAAEDGSSRNISRPRQERWLWAVGIAVAIQIACLLIPRTRPGYLGVCCWLIGSEAVIWGGIALPLLIWGVVASWRRRPFWNRTRVIGFTGILALAFGFPALYTVYPSSYDARPSQVRFRVPMDGPVLVGWGGGTPDVNYHVFVPDQRWAYDLLAAKDGASFRGEGKRVEDYYCYGLAVVAPADGTVLATSDSDLDMPIGEMGGGKTASGNHIVIQVAPKEYLLLCHLKNGSLKVKAGDRVTQGQEIGQVGNSGNTSEPHLHIQLQDSPEMDWGEGIPLYFYRYRVGSQVVEHGIPTGGVNDKGYAGQTIENIAPPSGLAGKRAVEE
jgi:hypothetical protein